VLSEWVQVFRDRVVAARMVRSGEWKLIHYDHEDIPDQLFDLRSDPEELSNLASDRPDVLQTLTKALQQGWEPRRVAARFAEKREHLDLIGKWSRSVPPPEPPGEKWPIPESATARPERVI
jgi:hypothetical protein